MQWLGTPAGWQRSWVLSVSNHIRHCADRGLLNIEPYDLNKKADSTDDDELERWRCSVYDMLQASSHTRDRWRERGFQAEVRENLPVGSALSEAVTLMRRMIYALHDFNSRLAQAAE